ncbi:DNA ligase [Marinobacter salinexigens]|uniref:DNA ligase n=1 Tax=Marinobacter salinexigens TaxID=2919747 RepID=A0A5B0VAR7_9GAMM|nr:DNA ligase [Marinobacter salinexigens]KAA1171478.1 DNA ligase [Marinobacter salinexigens]
MLHFSTIITRPKALANFLFGLAVIALFSPLLHARPPSIPLANIYHEGIRLEDYWVSEKLDGVRAYWDGKRLWSRGGHVYRAPDWFTEGFPSQPLDGELWGGRETFSALSGVVRKSQPVEAEWRNVLYKVFDLPQRDQVFEERYTHLRALVEASGSRYLSLVVQRPVRNHESLMNQLETVVAAGGEGVMLKRKASLYLGGRSDDLLKVKPYQDAEAVVVRHIPGDGKYEGMMGSLLVALPSGRQFRIGTGFSDAERADPPPAGQTITFKYHGHTSTGLPRFASYLRVREDEPK